VFFASFWPHESGFKDLIGSNEGEVPNKANPQFGYAIRNV
jgi:hypothetical protein